MIVFIDPFSHGLSHVPVNAAIIETALVAEPGRALLVAAQQDHLSGMAELIDGREWKRAKHVSVMPPPVNARFMRRFLADFRNLREVFRRADRGSTLLVGDVAPATLYALRLNAMLRPSAFRSIAIVLHGNASALAGWRARNPFVRLTQLRSAMASAPLHARFLVLEESIRRSLVEVVPEFATRIVTFAHPLPEIEAKFFHQNPEEFGSCSAQRPVRIAFLGAAQPTKGFTSFLELARSITHLFPDKVEFHCIGWLPPECAALDLSVLTRQPSSRKISRAEFRDALKKMDYVCLPYSQELYRFSASGTLLDAVAAAKPIIALHSPIFDDLQSRFGNIGELCERVEDLHLLIKDLVGRGLDKNYFEQTRVMEKVRESRMPKNMISKWRSIFTHDDKS